MLADQSSSSADSGVHSSYTQSPITKHSSRKYVSSYSPIDFLFKTSFLDVNYMDFHLIVHYRLMPMKIKINIFMQPMINILRF